MGVNLALARSACLSLSGEPHGFRLSFLALNYWTVGLSLEASQTLLVGAILRELTGCPQFKVLVLTCKSLGGLGPGSSI